MKPETTVPEPIILSQSVEPVSENNTLTDGEQPAKKPHRIADMPALDDWFIQELRRELAENRRREAEQDAG